MNELLENIFCILLIVEVFSLQKVVQTLEEVVITWQEVRWIWWMRQNFVAQFLQLFKCWLYDVWSGITVEKNWALCVDQCWLQALPFLVYLIDLLSILLRCNGFTRIQKAAVDQTGSRPPKWLWPFLGTSLTLGSALELLLSPATELVVSGCQIQSTFHHTFTIQFRNGLLLLQRIREDNTSNWWFFLFFFGQFMR